MKQLRTQLNRLNHAVLTILLLKLLEAFAYFGLTQILVVHLTNDWGYSDTYAGTLFGLYGAMVSLLGIALGTFVDQLGAQRALKFGFGVATISRTLLAMTNSHWLLHVVLLGLLPLASALGIPVMSIVIRRNTEEEDRPFVFGLFYTTMNVGALLAG